MNDDRKRKGFEKPPEELREFDNISSPPKDFRKAEESERLEVMSPLKPKKP